MGRGLDSTSSCSGLDLARDNMASLVTSHGIAMHSRRVKHRNVTMGDFLCESTDGIRFSTCVILLDDEDIGVEALQSFIVV